MVSRAVLGRFLQRYVAATYIRKNADAARPEGYHWDFNAKAYVQDPIVALGSTLA